MFPTSVVEKVEKLEEMLATSRGFDAEKHDHHGPVTAFAFDEEARLCVPTSGLFGKLKVGTPPQSLTHHAFGQLCGLLGKVAFGKGSTKPLPASYLEVIPADLRAMVLNRHMTDYPDQGRIMARCYQDTCRAFVSDRYARIDNTELLTMLQKVLQDKGRGSPVKFIRSFVTPDAVTVKMTVKDTRLDGDTSGGGYGIGVYIGNDEIGGTSLKVRPLLQRTSCTNSIIINREISTFETRHVGSPAAILTQFASALVQALGMGEEVLEKFAEAKYTELPDFTQVLRNLATAHSWSEDLKFAVAAGTENQPTVQGVVNGLSFAAHHAEGLSDDSRLELEQLAGDYLFAPAARWQALSRK